MRSPVFTHLNATLNGLTTIRAFGAQNILRNEFDKHQDCHTSAWFMFIAASSSFGLYMDMLCFVFITLITFSFLIVGDGKIHYFVIYSMCRIFVNKWKSFLLLILIKSRYTGWVVYNLLFINCCFPNCFSIVFPIKRYT